MAENLAGDGDPFETPTDSSSTGPPSLRREAGRARGFVIGLLSLLIGLAIGWLLFHENPSATLLEAQRGIQTRDETIADLHNQIAILESELNRANPEAAERARREIDLAQREQALAVREAAVAQREQYLRGRWTLPKVPIPAPQQVGGFFSSLSEWFAKTLNSDESLRDATRPGTPVAP